MSAASVTLRGRAAIDKIMVDTCVIHRFDPAVRVWNESTGQYDPGPGVEVYRGRCRVQVRSDINSNAVEAVVGDHEWTYRTATVQLPIEGTERVVADCVLTLLSSPHDPARVGIKLNLQADTKGKTHATHRRFRSREVLA